MQDLGLGYGNQAQQYNGVKEVVSVSVCMLTFNHEKYIRRAIESVMKQEVPFFLELIIGDDASSDGTKEICEYYQRKYPKNIFYKRNEANLGMNNNFLQTYNRCSGKYVAMLEGDDEWIDSRKIVKQVSILETNPDVAIAYSNAAIHDTQNPDSTLYFHSETRPATVADKYAVLEHCIIPTCTVIFRNRIVDFPAWFNKTKASGYFLFYFLVKHGAMYYYDEVTALYNHHYSGLSRLTSIKDMLYGDSLFLYKLANEYYADDRVFAIAVQKNIQAVNNLFHMSAFAKAIQLFWRQPFLKIFSSNLIHLGTLARLFLKIHFLLFLSKRERRGAY